MRALVYDQFESVPQLRQVPDPTPSTNGVVIKVEATGLCRSDWHGWMGHDPDITLPHIPGHEFAGSVIALGNNVRRARIGDRVTLPFVCGCGHCPRCVVGDHQVCDQQFQPGFTHWGSFAEYVAVDYADTNLVSLPETMDFVTAASLGCRFATSFRAVTAQGKVRDGDWVAVHGCGGVGLSTVMIASALGARVIAVDIRKEQLELARSFGAEHLINVSQCNEIPIQIRALSDGGVHMSIDALGSADTCLNSLSCLRKRGKHIQVGLMHGEHRTPPIPMDQIIANELEIIGSHGMPAHAYPKMMTMIEDGRLNPGALVGELTTLEQAAETLTVMDRFEQNGITIVDRL